MDEYWLGCFVVGMIVGGAAAVIMQNWFMDKYAKSISSKIEAYERQSKNRQ